MIHFTKNDHYWSFWCHWWLNHQDQEVFQGNRAVEAVEASEVAEVAEATEVNEAAEVSKAWKITTEDFSVILVLEFNNLRTNMILTESWKFLLNFSNFSVSGCWGQFMLLSWKLVDETQISKPQNHTNTFKQNLTSIFISVMPKLLLTFQCEIPCSTLSNFVAIVTTLIKRSLDTFKSTLLMFIGTKL